VIGWYVHHVGRGHLHHAVAVAAQLAEPVTALSSLPRPDVWCGDWVQLERDDRGSIADPDAHTVLHWAPRHNSGLRARMAAIAAWIDGARPRALVVDLSVEVCTLARLMGVPVITFCLPGTRTDPPHRMAWDLADAIIAPWPQRHPNLCVGLEPYLGKVCFTGGISRWDRRERPGSRDPRHGVVLAGLGGSALPAPEIAGWTWTVFSRDNWCPDPWPQLAGAAVVLSHAGLAAVADVAAARVPAVVVPQVRPFGEQLATAAALDRDGLAAVVADPSSANWARLADAAIARGGAGWTRWSDGNGAARAASAIAAVAERGAPSCAS
jgi:hypothetical protein